MNYLSIIFIITILISCYQIYLKYFQKHLFWDTQPVSRNYLHHGVISYQSKKIPVVTNNKYHIKHFSHLDTSVYNHLNHNFIKNYLYSDEYLKWSLSPIFLGNLGLYDKGNIIASISCKLIRLNIYGKDLHTTYVDNLAINKSYRNKRLAPVLISHQIKRFPTEFFIFKIDKYPLPFDYLTRFSYYYYDLTNFSKLTPVTNWVTINNDNIKKAYFYFNIQKVKFSIYQDFTLIKFREHFLPINKTIYTYQKIIDNQCQALFSFFLTTLIFKGKTYLNAELLLFLSSNILTDINVVLTICQQLKVKYLTINTLGFNNLLLQDIHFRFSKYGYLQMYNYGLTKKIKSDQILFCCP